MTKLDDVARSLNTVGLAAWFGGSLMGAVALRGSSPEALRVEGEVWRRWSVFQTAAIATHLAGSTRLAAANKGRLIGQAGVARVSAVKTACTMGAVGATVYAGVLGRQVHRQIEEESRESEGPQGSETATGSEAQGQSDREGQSAGGAEEGSGVREALADRQSDELTATLRKLRAVQAAVPLLTGAMLVADARLGEQQRPMEVLRGVAARAIPDALQSLPEALQSLPDALQHSAPVEAVSSAAKHFPDVVRSMPERRHS